MQLSYRIFSTVSGKSVLISIDDKRYAFNIFEGFQRYCIEQQLSMCSIGTVFLPDKYAVPGFVGMYLSHGDSKSEKLDVISDFPVDMDAINEFVQNQRIEVRMGSEYRDDNISVTSVIASDISSYFISFKRVNGKFHPEKVPAGVPKQLYKLLADGVSVPFEGKLLDGNEYREESIELGMLVIVFSTAGFEKLLERCKKAKTIICVNVEAAIYFYNALKGKDVTTYYVVNSDGVDYNGFYKEQIERNKCDKNFMLPLYLHDRSRNCDAECKLEKSSELDDFDGRLLRTGDVLEFSRNDGFSVVPAVQPAYACTRNCFSNSGILFLGTGCSQPSKYRNVSAIVYETEDSAVLFDCGEDTLGQIMRIYGNLNVLEKLRIIYLSHSHADHVLGVAGILKHLNHKISIVGPFRCRKFISKYYENKNGAYIEHSYIQTDEVKRLEKDFYVDFEGGSGGTSDNMKSGIDRYVKMIKVGDLQLQIVGCIHSLDSTSVVLLDSARGWSMGYSGDTRPSVLFAILSKGVDVLIHEATFTGDQLEYARAKNHSTEEEAVQIFISSKADKLILTHFSNRNTHSTGGSRCYAADFYYVPLFK